MVHFLINLLEYLSNATFGRYDGRNGRDDAGIERFLGRFDADSPDLFAGGFRLQNDSTLVSWISTELKEAIRRLYAPF